MTLLLKIVWFFFIDIKFFEVTGTIQIKDCSGGPGLMRPTENYFDAHYAHLHIIIDSFFFSTTIKKSYP
jgi:hypothetical protein